MSKSDRVKGEVAIVTGAALGIGRACSKLLSANGAAVAVTDVLDKEGHQVVSEICQEGGEATYWHLDITDEKCVHSVFKAVADKYGRVTILVNNAGISGANRPTHEITATEWETLMKVNVEGVFFCTKYAIPLMMAAGKGSIINLSSIYGIVGAPDFPPYHASKGAVRLMSKTDALMYASKGIRVNSVHPGFIWTPMVENFINSQAHPEEARKAIDALHPLGHIGEPDDVAYGVLYLASDESKFVTGTELIIDGGYTAR